MVYGGDYRTVFLDNDGKVFVCGDNDNGSMGTSATRHLTEIPSLMKTKITAISAGLRHTACIDDLGNLFMFGRNSSGQLGLGDTSDRGSPTKLENFPSVRSVTCGLDHTFCIASDSTILCFGKNSDGQLGLGHCEEIISSPQQLKLKDSIFQIACGDNHTMFLNSSGAVYSCGKNDAGQLGLGQEEKILIPTQIVLDSLIVYIATGYSFSIILTAENSVMTTGSNSCGQLGLNDTTSRNSFHKIPGLTALYISCGKSHVVCLTFNNEIFSWGESPAIGASTRYKPEKLCSNVIDFAATYNSTYVVTEQRKVLVCGSNSYGKLGVGDNSDRNTLSATDAIKHTLIKHRENLGKPIIHWDRYEQMIKLSSTDRRNLKQMEIFISQMKELIKCKKFNPDSWDVLTSPLNLESWDVSNKLVLAKMKLYSEFWAEMKETLGNSTGRLTEINSRIEELELELADMKKQRKQTEEKIALITEDLSTENCKSRLFHQFSNDVSVFAERESLLNEKFCKMLREKTFAELSGEELSLVLWKMNLPQYQPLFQEVRMDGQYLAQMQENHFVSLGVNRKDSCALLYHAKMMNCPKYLDDQIDCVVCYHNTPEQTVELLQEYEVPIDSTVILDGNWIMPYLIYVTSVAEEFDIKSVKDRFDATKKLETLKKVHEDHLAQLSQ